MDFDNWLSERIEFYNDKATESEIETARFVGLAQGLEMCRQFLRENYVEDKEPITNCCFLHTAAGGSCESPEMMRCSKCDAPEGQECKVCKHTSCQHMWGKAHPIQAEQQWICLGCGAIKK